MSTIVMITTISIAVVTWVMSNQFGDFPANCYKGTESSPQESGKTSGHKL